MSDKFNLRGSVAVVTGAAGGIGRAICHELADCGARLALVDRDRTGLDQLASELPGASIHVVDLTDRAALTSLPAEVLRHHGRIDLLVNNAGLTIHGRFSDYSSTDIDTVVDVDLGAVLHGARVFLEHLESPVHIVIVASMAGLTGFPFQSIYSAAKAALIGFGEALRIELRTRQIGVSTIILGTIATDFMARAQSYDGTSERLGRLMKRFGTPPERVARATVRAIRHNTGQIRVGWDAHLLATTQRWAPGLLSTVLTVAYRHGGFGRPE